MCECLQSHSLQRFYFYLKNRTNPHFVSDFILIKYFFSCCVISFFVCLLTTFLFLNCRSILTLFHLPVTIHLAPHFVSDFILIKYFFSCCVISFFVCLLTTFLFLNCRSILTLFHLPVTIHLARERSCTHLTGLDWTGLDWTGLDCLCGGVVHVFFMQLHVPLTDFDERA